MIGAPPGYVGYEEGGALTEAVRRRPYQVVLFDEVEKAHPDVFNVLLQVLDDGRLTDGQGRTVDFRNVLVDHDLQPGQRSTCWPEPAARCRGRRGGARRRCMEAVRMAFRPEFLNRLDEMLVFHRLTRDQMGGIVRHPARAPARHAGRSQAHPEPRRGGRGLAGRRGLRSGLRRPAAQAGDPALAAEPAGGIDPGREDRRRRARFG